MTRERRSGQRGGSRAEPPGHGHGRRAAGEASGPPTSAEPPGGHKPGETWSELRPGDPVESPEGELIGLITAVRADEVAVRDPQEGRELLIPRAALAARPGGGLLLRRGAVHAAGEGPERFVREGNLGDEWVVEQTQPERAITIEGASPLEARRQPVEGPSEDSEEREDVGAADDELPSELP